MRKLAPQAGVQRKNSPAQTCPEDLHDHLGAVEYHTRDKYQEKSMRVSS